MERVAIRMIQDIFLFLFGFEGEFSSSIHEYGIWIYLIIFAVLFLECGIVFLPLTGNSLLFIAGVASSEGNLDPFLLVLVSFCAAGSGYILNFWSGRYLGVKFLREKVPGLFERNSMGTTSHLFERYGPHAIIISSYLPMIRKFAPFLCGIWQMDDRRFVLLSLISSALWVIPLVIIGFFIGKFPFFQLILPYMAILVVISLVASLILSLRMFFPRPRTIRGSD